MCEEAFGKKFPTPIIMIEAGDAKRIHEKLLNNGILTGFIRPPTVKVASIRLIARLGEDKKVRQSP